MSKRNGQQNSVDHALRPESLDQYVGQAKTKELLRVAIDSAKKRGDRLEHVLLNGPPGLGKTTLSRIIAYEMGWKVKTTIGASLRKVDSIKNLFFALDPETIVFIDEVHRITRPIQEQMYPVLEDGILYWSFGGTAMETPVKNMTVVGATTHVGKLAEPFQERFGLHLQLDYYSARELLTILAVNDEKLGVGLDGEELGIIATRSRGTPRTANRLLRWIRDFRVTGNNDPVETILWQKFRLDSLGLNVLDRRVLRILAKSDGLGIENLATMAREAEETITGRVEPFLIAEGMMERRGNGRAITQRGIEHLARFSSRKNNSKTQIIQSP